MAEPTSSSETQNTGSNQPAGNNGSGDGGQVPPPALQPNAAAPPTAPPTTDPTTPPPPGGDTGGAIPKARFDQVNQKYKDAETELTKLRKQNEEFRKANLTAEEKRAEEFKSLQEKAASAEALQAQLDAANKRHETHAKNWIDGQPDDAKASILAFAKAEGIEETDVAALYQKGLALQAAGLLSVQPTKPQPVPTHAGHPGAANPGAPPPPDTREGMRAALSKAFGGK